MDVLYQQDRQLQEATYYLRSLKLLDGPIASRYSKAGSTSLPSSLFVAYHNKTPYRGQINDQQSRSVGGDPGIRREAFSLWHEPDTTGGALFRYFRAEVKVFPVPSGPDQSPSCSSNQARSEM